MTSGDRHPPADRGMETIVSHVLSVGITTLLIIGLVAGATGFMQTQESRAAETELETIGNRLAGAIASADRLAQGSDGVELRVTLADGVVGSPYTVTLVHGSCSAVPTDTCLELSADAHDVSTVVAVRNETSVHLDHGVGGRFQVSSNGSSGFENPERRRLDMSPRIGIGDDVGGPGTGTSFSQPPIAAFRFEPDPPDVSDNIQFDASGSTDPDGTIATYEWDFDGDGTYELSQPTPTPSWTYGTPGDRNVTLRVTDGAGMTANTTTEIDVSGLEYNGDMSAVSGTPANPRAVTFTVTNQYVEPITIERFLIDPADDGIDGLNNWSNNEIKIDADLDGSAEGYVDWFGSASIPDDGLIVNIDGPGHSGSEATISPGDTARITLTEFDDTMVNDDLTVGIRYRIGGGSDVGANVVTDTVGTP
jgi:PKD repeat protein